MNRDEARPASVVSELIGWLAFVLFVGAIWKLRQTLDRSHPER